MGTTGQGHRLEVSLDRVRGILLGLYAGDRNGGPIRMALELSEYLLACGSRFRPGDLMQRYVSWFLGEGFDTGPVAERVFKRVAEGVPPQEAVLMTHQALQMRTAGCNPAHRVAPLAMSAYLPDDELPVLACQEAKLTHWDPLAGRVSAAVVVLCRALVRGEEWDTCLHKASKHCDVLIQGGGESRTVPRLSPCGFAPEVLRAAAFFAGSSRDLETALARSVDFAGPANYCPVLVGAIGGARWGASRIPQAWLTRSPILQRVESVSDSLAATWRRFVEESARLQH